MFLSAQTQGIQTLSQCLELPFIYEAGRGLGTRLVGRRSLTMMVQEDVKQADSILFDLAIDQTRVVLTSHRFERA